MWTEPAQHVAGPGAAKCGSGKTTCPSVEHTTQGLNEVPYVNVDANESAEEDLN